SIHLCGLPRVSVDLDFLEDDDILGGSPGGEGGSNGIGTNHEPCDILQQSLAEANITEQSLQEAEAELDLGSFGIPGLTQVVQTLPPDAGGATVGVGIGIGGNTAAIFSGSAQDMLGSVLAQQGLQLQSQVMNKAISVQPFMPPVGLGNVTLQPISSIQALSNGGQSGHLGIGQIQVVGQPTVMTINQSGQPILAKAMGGYQLHQSGPELSSAGSQTGLTGSGGGLLIQGNKATLGPPTVNGPAVCVSSTISSSGATMTAPTGLVGFGSTQLSSGLGSQVQAQGQIMQNVIIQRTPTPIQPKPPQGGAIQSKIFKQQQQQQSQPQPSPQALQNDTQKTVGLQQIPVSAAQNVAFLTGKPGSNVVLSTQAGTQGPQFQQTLFKQQGAQPSGKPLSVHLLNQSNSIVIPSQTVLQGQNHQFLLPQLQAGGQILTQHPGGHIITSQGPGGQLIANQILTTNQNINLGQVLTSQGHPGAAHILSGPIQLQPGQMGTPTLFQMPVSLAQSQSQTTTHTVSGHAQTVIQGMPIQNSLTMLSQMEGLSPAVSLQPALQQQHPGGVPGSTGATTGTQGQPGDSVPGQQQALKIQSMSPSPALTAAPPVAERPLPSQSPLTLSQQIQSPHHQQQSRPPSQPQPPSQTPSSHPPLFIVHNQIAGSPQPAPQSQHTPPQQTHVQVQLQPQLRPASQPSPFQQDMPPMSQSPKPQPPAAQQQLQFSAPPVGVCATTVVNKPQMSIQGLTTEQQHLQQLVAAQIQTLSSIAQPSPQQKQLLEKLILEQLRKHQGSALHPNYSAPFHSFDDTLHRLLPYHLYQGTANSSQDYQRVDDEFERVSCQLLKRTQAMLDKYRHLLFSESKRLGPSAEMVMIDRMFIQEEKVALSQDKILAKERPGMIGSCSSNNLLIPLNFITPLHPPPPHPPVTAAASSHSPFPPTKLVIKQGGGGASVSCRASSSSSSSSFHSLNSRASADDVDDVALPQRTSKPPIKTYEARRRIGLKLKIKQDQTGFGKVVHNTALDPVHTPPQTSSAPPTPSSQNEPAKPALTPSSTMNGTLENHEPKPNPASTATPSQTTCRLPLRKTYRENVSPRVRPGVPGGGDENVSRGEEHMDQDPERHTYKRLGGKNRHRPAGTFRMDQHAPGPPSPSDPFSDSPDMDNASFSSGSPQDDSLNEHLQCAIDSILNLQQETSSRHIRGGAGRPHHHRQSQRQGGAAVGSSHRSVVLPTSSASGSSQVGGHNGSLVPQTQSR
uniref:GLTSCR protein conserved domain-containing protein n=1 Tax=Gouania willdenowi TaxID=441366 RepID=A0A8C5H2X4_GOUWI